MDEIQHGTVSDAIPDFLYNKYDNLGHLTEVQMRQSGVLEKQTYEYDAVGRLTSAVGTGPAGYDYDYTYGAGGNLATRVNRTPNPDQTRTYTYGTPGDHHAHAVMSISGSMTASYTYDANGNMGTRTEILGAYTQTFDVENRLTKVTREAGANDQIAEFYYDADGNRILTIYKTGPTETSRVYTPYPDYEESVPATGGVTKRVSYFLAGQLIAVRVITATTNNYYYAFADQLGNVAGYYKVDDQFLSNSPARYDPYGVYRTEPPASVNPGISDRGYTGHRMNNTGTNDLGLIYMNARYYLPEVGRFISADTIVPDPSNPQSYNRYTYVLNDPINSSDPTGHMATSGCDGYVEGCMSDPNTWGNNFIDYLEDDIDFDDPSDNPQGQIILELYNYTLPLGLEDGASVNEIVSYAIEDTVSLMKHARAGWYPLSDDADLVAKFFVFASVADSSSEGSLDGERGSVIPRYNRAGYGEWNDSASIHREVFSRDNYSCFYCGKRGGNLTLDHVTSLKTHWDGGGYAMTAAERNNNVDNLVTACPSCNSSKGSTRSGLFFILLRLFGGK